MLHFRCAAGLLASLLFIAAARADSPDPLQLVPEQADFCIKIERPRALFEFVQRNQLIKQFQAIDGLRELYDSTNFRRLTQLVAYFERELGAGYPEILDQLTGGGVVYANQLGPRPPQLLVLQGRNEQMLRRFVEVGSRILDQELARQEAKERLEQTKYRNLDTIHIGKEFHAAAAGTALLISNRQEALHKALDLYLDKDKGSLAKVAYLSEARKLAGAGSNAWMWLNLDKVHKVAEAKDFFRLPRDNPFLTVLFGGILDVAARAPFLCAGLHTQDQGLLLSFRLPRGRQDMPEALNVTVPPLGQPGSRPLLEPPGVLYSGSFFLDIPNFWEERTKLFNEKQVKGLEDLDKASVFFLSGSPMSKLLGQAGAYHRIVVAHQSQSGYQITPGQKLPSFALVTELRDPEAFSKRMEATLRGLAFFATTQVKIKNLQEKHGDLKILAYRFPEDGQFAPDRDNLRFNFSPCFVTVGKQFVASSTIELCHELIDLLKKEANGTPATAMVTPFRERFYAAGGAQVLDYYRDRLFTQTILDQAIPPDRAQRQVSNFIDLVRQLGVLEIKDSYEAKAFQFDIRLRFRLDQHVERN
jgi:hypothetical protein